MKDIKGDQLESKICEKWNVSNETWSISTILPRFFSLGIVLISVISRKIYVYLITKIKLHRSSEEKFVGIVSTTIVYFCNYGLMYLIAPWNLIDATNTDNPGEWIFTGFYSDFNEEWYLDIGNLIITT